MTSSATGGGPAPIIVTALLGKADAAAFDAVRRRWFPPERNHLAAHLTMFHHLPPSIEPELKSRLAVAVRRKAPMACVTGLMSLGRGVAYGVDAPELEVIRADLAQAFSGLLTPQDQAAWRPHITVQNKVEPAVAKATLAELQRDFSPHPLAIAGLASWWYRGGPWQPLSRHMFA